MAAAVEVEEESWLPAAAGHGEESTSIAVLSTLSVLTVMAVTYWRPLIEEEMTVQSWSPQVRNVRLMGVLEEYSHGRTCSRDVLLAA